MTKGRSAAVVIGKEEGRAQIDAKLVEGEVESPANVRHCPC